MQNKSSPQELDQVAGRIRRNPKLDNCREIDSPASTPAPALPPPLGWAVAWRGRRVEPARWHPRQLRDVGACCVGRDWPKGRVGGGVQGRWRGGQGSVKGAGRGGLVAGPGQRLAVLPGPAAGETTGGGCNRQVSGGGFDRRAGARARAGDAAGAGPSLWSARLRPMVSAAFDRNAHSRLTGAAFDGRLHSGNYAPYYEEIAQ